MRKRHQACFGPIVFGAGPQTVQGLPRRTGFRCVPGLVVWKGDAEAPGRPPLRACARPGPGNAGRLRATRGERISVPEHRSELECDHMRVSSKAVTLFPSVFDETILFSEPSPTDVCQRVLRGMWLRTGRFKLRLRIRKYFPVCVVLSNVCNYPNTIPKAFRTTKSEI